MLLPPSIPSPPRSCPAHPPALSIHPLPSSSSLHYPPPSYLFRFPPSSISPRRSRCPLSISLWVGLPVAVGAHCLRE
eukprot:7583337-Pyramimonas_sp.AAC.1